MANTFTDLSQNAVVLSTFPILARTATANGTSVDCIDIAANYTSAFLAVGAVTGTSPTMDVKIQESNDASTWVDAQKGDGTAAAFTQVVTAGANTQSFLSYKQQRRYARGVATLGGTSPSFTFGLYIVGQDGTTGANPGGWTNTSGATVV